MKKIFFAFTAIISLFSVSALAQSFAITNAKIVTVSGAEIAKGNVIIRDGLISDVGENAKVPADAKIFDATGLTVYPGLFDANSSLGLPQPRPQGVPQAGGQTAQPTSNSNYPSVLQPEVMAFEKLIAGEAQFESARNNGFTSVLTVPREGIFNGQSAIINLAGDTVSTMVLKSPFAQHITYRTNPVGYPGSLMGTFSALRQMFLDAQRLNDWKKAYATNPLGMKRPDADASLEALIPLINREMPVVFNANSEIEIIRSLDFAKEFNLRPIINGGFEAWKVVDRLKKADAVVFVSLNFPKKNTSNSPEADPEPLDVLRLRANAPKNAALLSQAGVKFAFQSGGMQNLGDFLTNASKAIENGLSRENALKAMTWTTADVFGLSNRLGSIEKGKIANLVVTKGDIFAKDKVFTHIFVDGKLFEQKPPPKSDATKPTGTPNAAPSSVLQVAGTWNLSVDAGGQTLPITLVLTQQGSKISGTMQAGPLGTTEIKNGEVTAKGMSFDATVTFGGQSIDLSFSGTVTGNQLTGNLSSPMGPAPVTGTKVP